MEFQKSAMVEIEEQIEIFICIMGFVSIQRMLSKTGAIEVTQWKNEQK